MPLIPNEDQALLRDSARGFFADKAPVAHLRHLRDTKDKDGFSRDLWRESAAMGFPGLLIAEEQGGSALGFAEVAIVMEKIGRNLTPSPFLATGVVAASALKKAGGAKALALLTKIAAGEMLVALAIDEHSKHAPQKIALAAKRSGNGFTLSGAKTFVIDGHVADVLIVAAKTDSGLTLFLVDPKAKGLSIERTAMIDAHNAARITFDDVPVDADAVLGEIDGGQAVLDAALDAGRLAVAAELLGCADEAFSRTVAYLKERKQFGKAIGEFQALQHRVAHLFSELEVSRAAVAKAAEALDKAPEKAAAVISMAKARACSTADLAVREAVQMHGGMGMTDALDIGFFMKRARVAQELFGDANFHADRLAALRGY
jgi:alkylation response protein AidB-like acyl-CoA dehydrogenase